MKKKGLNLAILLSALLLILEIYRWYQWNVDWSKLTVWQFLTNKGNTGLLWNLLLAWIPVILALIIPKDKRTTFVNFLCFVWLLWLPNTLYMITDLKYFRADKKVDLWQEVAFFGIYAFLGFLLYGVAVYILWEKLKFGKKWMAIITVLTIIGVLIGRVLRWNSWDVFTDPGKIISFFTNLF